MKVRWILWACSAALAVAAEFPAPVNDPPASAHSATAVLAGGCFWGVEAVFEHLKGVSDVVSGYAGGEKSTAHYEIVATGSTGHAESVRITYDPTVISYGKLLQIFFSVAHDPTELDRQGPDEGPQYRSAVFYMSDEQKFVAATYIRRLDQAKIFKHPIVTQLTPLTMFYLAEAHHQDFIAHNPHNMYVVFNDLPKLAQLKKKYPELVNPK